MLLIRPRLRRAGCLTLACCLFVAGCSLSHPHYVVPDVHVGTPTFARALEAHTLSSPVGDNRLQLLLNGDEIFPAKLAAIRQTRATITFANFIFEDGAIAQDITSALAERCRAEVRVHVLLDAVGSSHMPKKYRIALTDAGCQLAWYHSLNPFAIKRINHRNHRRILVVDGRVGFTGGARIGGRGGGGGRRARHMGHDAGEGGGPVGSVVTGA